ncbi:MAG: trypsin-like peptidase domain-containing protein [Planctomycetota bacterium]
MSVTRQYRCFCLPLYAIIAVAMVVSPAAAQQEAEDEAGSRERAREAFRNAIERIWVPPHRYSNGYEVRSAFNDVIADAAKATVRIRSDGKTIALGGVVGPDGWVLTKASRAKGRLTVTLADKRELDARLVGVDREYDLAVLKIAAKDLPTLTLSEEIEPLAGGWVATPGLTDAPVAVGVVSVVPRKIPHRPGILGVQLGDMPADGKPGALVLKVFADTGAERAGVLVNDVITRINDQPIESRLDLIREVRRHSPLDSLEIQLRRGDKQIIVTAVLTGQAKEMFSQTRSQYQNSLGSQLSQRRFGFPIALQHDSVLKPNECGGPLVDIDGRVIGFNIARAGRTETYAIPTSAVLPLMYKLMSGEQAPETEE